MSEKTDIILINIFIIILSLLLFTLLILTSCVINEFFQKEKCTIIVNEEEISISCKTQQMQNLIKHHRIQHPEIVLAQTVLETGCYTSEIFTAGNNATGMKEAKQRPTSAVGTENGHAVYHSLSDCILDYAIWQRMYAWDLSEAEYYAYLQRVYSQDQKYAEKIKKIVKGLEK